MIYVAGPYSHTSEDVREDRFQKLNAYAAFLMAKGFHVYSPITHGHPIAKASVMPLPTDWDYWKAHCSKLLAACTELHVLKLKGWKYSKGVQAEIALAKELKLPIYYVEKDYAKRNSR